MTKPKKLVSAVIEEPGEDMGLHKSRNMLFNGVTISDISVIFNVDRRIIAARIAGNVRPVGQRGNADVYMIRDVAPFFVKPIGDIEAYLKKMRPEDLPPKLSKAYWDALKARQEVQARQGLYWHQDRIIDTFSAAAKIMRTGLLLLPDEIGRQTELTEDQKIRLRQSVADMMSKIQKQLVDELASERAKQTFNQIEPDEDAGAAEEVEGVEGPDEAPMEEWLSGL